MANSYNDNDVLSGRGKGFYTNPGNQELLRLVDQLFAYYEASIKSRRKEIRLQVVSDIKRRGGRFLKKDEQGNWQEMTKNEAADKVAQAFVNKRSKRTQALAEQQQQHDEQHGLPVPLPPAFINELLAPLPPPEDASINELPAPLPPREDLLAEPHMVQNDFLLSIQIQQRMERERIEALNEVERLRTLNAQLTDARDQANDLRQGMERERTAALNEIEKLRTLNAELTDAREQASAHAHDLREKLEKSEEAKDKLKEDLKESAEAKDNLKEELKESRAEANELHHKISVFQATMFHGESGDDFFDMVSRMGNFSLESEESKSAGSIEQQPRNKTARTGGRGLVSRATGLPDTTDNRSTISGQSNERHHYLEPECQILEAMKVVKKLKVKKGAYFQGSVLFDKPHGLGVLKKKDGKVVIANWFHGVATGSICVFYPNGDAYYGQSKCKKKHGMGKFFSHKDCYEHTGNFKNNLRDGKGRFKFTEGHKLSGHLYEGDFVEDAFEGNGIHRHPNGTILEQGRFVKWELVEEVPKAPESTGG